MIHRFKLIPAVYLIIRNDNKILMLQRKNTGYYDGYYSLPAGHVDGQESLKEAICREAQEEININVQEENAWLVHTMHRVSDKPNLHERLDSYFEALSWENDPVNNEPNKSYQIKWIDLKKLPEKTVPEVKCALNHYMMGSNYSEYGWNLLSQKAPNCIKLFPSQNPTKTIISPFISQFPDIKLYKIGKYISHGFEHLVFHYDKDEVIKVPKNLYIRPPHTPSELKTHKKIMETYFPDTLIETEIIHNNNRYCMFQPFIKNIKPVNSNNINNIQSQLEKIIKKNRKMIRETGYSLDFFGFPGIQNTVNNFFLNQNPPEIGNLIINNQNKIKIIDLGMINLKEKSPVAKIQNQIAFEFTKFFMETKYNYNIGIH